MSETINKAEEKREPFVAELEEPIPFKYDAQASILTSTKLADPINQFFKSVFADYEGCRIISTNRGLSLALYAKHVPADQRDENLHYMVELSSAKKTNNSIIDSIRRKDYSAQYGDRYSLTEDGEANIKPLLQYHLRQQKKPNWGTIISEISDNQTNSFYPMKTEQYTMISGLDLNLVCSLLFGKKDADGNSVVYDVSLKGALNGMPGVNNPANQVLILWVNRINYDKLCETYASLGFGSASTIIR